MATSLDLQKEKKSENPPLFYFDFNLQIIACVNIHFSKWKYLCGWNKKGCNYKTVVHRTELIIDLNYKDDNSKCHFGIIVDIWLSLKFIFILISIEYECFDQNL